MPFSRNYVRHLAGWYAQKHPDEDFAETFAVWLTPRCGWRKRYRGWGAMAKLRYMDRIARELGNADPVRRRGYPDITVDEMESTVADFYHQSVPEAIPVVDLALDTDLVDIFNVSKRQKKTVRPAQEFLHAAPQDGGRQGYVLDGSTTSADQAAGGSDRETDRRAWAARGYAAGKRSIWRKSPSMPPTLATNYMTRGKFVQTVSSRELRS